MLRTHSTHDLRLCWSTHLKASVSGNNSQFSVHTESVPHREHRRLRYQRVFDERKRPIRGLWVRNGRCPAQLAILNEATGETRNVAFEKGRRLTFLDCYFEIGSPLSRVTFFVLCSAGSEPCFSCKFTRFGTLGGFLDCLVGELNLTGDVSGFQTRFDARKV
jgi:hypothetical protein